MIEFGFYALKNDVLLLFTEDMQYVQNGNYCNSVSKWRRFYRKAMISFLVRH